MMAKTMFGVQAANQGLDPITFAEGEKQMGEKVHGKDEQDRRRHAGKNSAPRKTNPERRRDENDHETGPGQREPILQMGRETARARTAGKSELKCR